MSVMSEGVYDEAVADIVGPESMLSDSVIVKDMDIRRDPSVTTGGCLPIRLICSNKRDPTTVETLREFEKK